MFVLNELEKAMENVVKSKQNDKEFKITLPDIERVRVDQLNVFNDIHLSEVDMKAELRDPHVEPLNLTSYISRQSYLTTDSVFASITKRLILDKLTSIPQRAYPTARLMICDHESYQYLLKFQYFTHKLEQSSINEENVVASHRYVLHKRPFCITAVVLLSDVLDLLDQVGKPIAKVREDGIATFNYSIVKQIFPYIKITDLIVVLGHIGPLKLRTFTLDAPRSQQVIQYMTHFARSAHLIELLPIKLTLGQLHTIYDNVAVFQPPSIDDPPEFHQVRIANHRDRPTGGSLTNQHLQLGLLQLADIAYRLHKLLMKLDWQLESITFRSADPDGFSKIFSQILQSVVGSGQVKKDDEAQAQTLESKSRSIVPTRVLVLDRSFDLQGLLRHSDRYGPFLEQEQPKQAGALSGVRLDSIDPLDGILHFEKLTDVLRTILSHSTDPSRGNPIRTIPTGSRKLKPISSSAIRRHLDAIKAIYVAMSEGYLLLLKMESSLGSIVDELRNFEGVLDSKWEIDTAERLKRTTLVLKQLTHLSTSSISPMNVLRVALILIDTINMFLYLHNDPGRPVHKMLRDIKHELISMRDFGSLRDQSRLNSQGKKQDDLNKDKMKINSSARMKEFDKISRERCGNRSTSSLEEIIEAFYTRKLRADSYSTIKLASTGNGLVKNVSRNKIIVLVLGSISYDELNRIKLLESTLMRRRKSMHQQQGANLKSTPSGKQTTAGPAAIQSGDILTISSNIIRPEEFVASL